MRKLTKKVLVKKKKVDGRHNPRKPHKVVRAKMPKKPPKIKPGERMEIARKNPSTGKYELTISKEKFTKLIYACGGLVKYIAAACRVSRQTIYNWKKDFPWVAQAMKDCDEDTIDLAVHNVVKNIRRGKEYTTTWYLDRKGKDRGLSPPKQIVQHDYNDLENLDDKTLDKLIQDEQERIDLCQKQLQK